MKLRVLREQFDKQADTISRLNKKHPDYLSWRKRLMKRLLQITEKIEILQEQFQVIEEHKRTPDKTHSPEGANLSPNSIIATRTESYERD